MADHPTVYLEYERETDAGQSYLVVLRNNIDAAITVQTPCSKKRCLTCPPELDPVFKPAYMVGGISNATAWPNWEDMLCGRVIASGESAEFTVPKKYLPRDSAIFLKFEYEWEGGRVYSYHGEPEHYVELAGPIRGVSDVPF
jgi:hypothetical protein